MNFRLGKVVLLPRYVLAGLIRVYQATLSPDHSWRKYRYPGGYCPFYPTCSEYTRQAVMAYGVIRGLMKGLRRVARCHPWQQGGVDLP